MKALNKQAKKVFLHLIEGVEIGQAKIIDNANGAFMAVHIDGVDENSHGKIYAIAHNYEQNGDLMADPDMTFLVLDYKDYKEVFPMAYQQDGLGLFQQAARFNDKDELLVKPRQQADITSFANTWMKNIKQQQKLDFRHINAESKVG